MIKHIRKLLNKKRQHKIHYKHKKRGVRKWGFIILGVLLLGLIVTIPQLSNNQSLFGRAASDPKTCQIGNSIGYCRYNFPANFPDICKAGEENRGAANCPKLFGRASLYKCCVDKNNSQQPPSNANDDVKTECTPQNVTNDCGTGYKCVNGLCELKATNTNTGGGGSSTSRCEIGVSSANGSFKGVCRDRNKDTNTSGNFSDNCKTGYVQGYCPGASNIQCCVKYIEAADSKCLTMWGDYDARCEVVGTVENGVKHKNGNGGTYYKNLCPGPSNVQCWVPGEPDDKTN